LSGIALQKWLQRTGVGSKHHVRELILTGRVTVGGCVVTRFAEPVGPDSVIAIDGEVVGDAAPRTVMLMHKPKKHLTAIEDPDGQPTLGQYLPDDAPVLFPVGRLDFNTEGALLWTNDGELARRILHPSWKLPKVYGIKIRGHLDDDDRGLERMRAGMRVGKASYQPAEVHVTAYRTRATWVEVTIREGQFRQLRKMCAACGYQIVKLRRLAIGPIELGDLRPRCVRHLTEDELQALDAAVGLDT